MLVAIVLIVGGSIIGDIDGSISSTEGDCLTCHIKLIELLTWEAYDKRLVGREARSGIDSSRRTLEGRTLLTTDCIYCRHATQPELMVENCGGRTCRSISITSVEERDGCLVACAATIAECILIACDTVRERCCLYHVWQCDG